MATLADRRGEKCVYFVQTLDGAKSLEKCRAKCCNVKQQERGLKSFLDVLGCLFGSFFAFFMPFFVLSYKFFGGNFVLQTRCPKKTGGA